VSPSPYNTTDLDPERTIERHVFHRDQFAHVLRWTYVLNQARIGDSIVDFGCGKGSLLEVLYRNRFRPSRYVGLDIRKRTIEQANDRYHGLPFPAGFYVADLCSTDDSFRERLSALGADKVCSFEVIEHVGKQNGKVFLENLMLCGGPDAIYYLSTPNHDPQVGAAGNHTYDSGDGRGVAVQEWDYAELDELLIDTGFEILEEFGTFASKKDYWPLLSDTDKDLYHRLKRYYDANLVSNIMAPLVPARLGRNCLRVMRRSS
jgi:SAM-dependent methyltransferase